MCEGNSTIVFVVLCYTINKQSGMQLMKTQRNFLFEALQRAGFSPSEFNIHEYKPNSYEDNTNTKCEFRNSPYFFDFVTRDAPFANLTSNYVRYSPGHTSVVDETQSIEWLEMTSVFERWLIFLKREVGASDLWAQMMNDVSRMGFQFGSQHEQYTVEEQRLLSDRIKILKGRIHEIPQINDKLDVVLERLDHLDAMVAKLSKFDWNALLIGTLISIVIQLGVSPLNAEKLWALVKIAFNNFFLN
jgi:hypothetical protein